MGNAVENLKRIIDHKYLVEVKDNEDLALKEDDPKNPYEVKLRNAPSGSVLVKTDAFGATRDFLRREGGIRRRADYALVSDDEMIFMELKSKKFNQTHVRHQLNGAQCVIDYCASIGQHFFNDPNFLAPAIERPRRFLLHVDTRVAEKRIPGTKKQRIEDKGSFKQINLRTNKIIYYRELTD